MTLPQQQQSGQTQSQHFLLKWNNHRSNMVNVFENLLQAENLVDVTIAVEGKFLKAHKIVLSACSPYFQAMFVNHTPSERYPIIVFHDMKFAHLKTLLDFMYRGEISIDEKDLGEVLKVAEALSIRGLSSFESDDEESEKSEQGQNQNGDGGNNNNNNNDSTEPSSTSTNNNNSSNSANTSSTNAVGTSSTNSTSGGNSRGSGGGGKGSNHYGKANGNSSPKGKHKDKDNQGESKKIKKKLKLGCDSSSKNCTTSSSVGVGNGTTFLNSSSSGSNDKSTGIGGGLSMGALNSGGSGGNTASSSAKYHFDGEINRPSSPEDEERTVLPPPPVKKKRGRQPKNKNLITAAAAAVATNTESINALINPSSLVQTAKAGKLQSRFHPELKTPLPRQGVRRRLPRRFPGVPTRLKRVKMSRRDDEVEDESGLLVPGEFIIPELADGPDSCEPLSEMSVRGLDLFKYASIEDGVYRCIECEKLRIPKTFKNKYSFQRHAFLYHEGNMRKVFPCPVCSREFSRPDKMKNHMRSIHEGGGAGSGAAGSNKDSNSGDNSPENVVLKSEADSFDV